MNSIECNICNSGHIEHFLKKDEWEIVRCKECGLVFLENIPSDEKLKIIYDDSFFKDGQKSPLDGSNIISNPTYFNAKKRIDKIKQTGYVNGELLDIGCATGIFMKAASSSYNCTGLDVSDVATQFAVKEMGLNAKCGTIFDHDYEKQSFDIITMWDVIEHVRDPDKYIEKINQIMKPGGLLVLSTGNIDSLMFKIQKKNWHLLIPPFHLYYFNKHNITKLLEKHGFEVKSLKLDGQYTNVGYIASKLKRMHERNKLVSLGDTIVKALKLDGLNIYLNLFDVMTVYAVKKE
jgi:2-polyprenyl-3-methyl-5-hydroxy-6-metoxy-1,4-benzoquinol methylase